MENILPAKKRIDSIDVLRGIIMIIMALDHVRDFFHSDAMLHDPTDPRTTTPILFFTRFITHYCAPVFVLLAGTAAFLYGRKKTKKELALFLLKRGLWLMLLEVTVVSLLFSFDPQYHFIALGVIWVTGLSMLILAAVIYLPLQTVFVIGLIMVAGHNLLDAYNTISMGTPPPLGWSLLHQQSFRQFGGGRLFAVLYPLIPWPGIMMMGYSMGSLFAPEVDAVKRKRILVMAGSLAILAFVVLRWINVYGDLVPWNEQKNTTATILSFFNVTKYPPSLLYCCITIGPALLVLAALEKIKAGWTNVAVIYGRVPMFYYLMHFFLIHTLCVILFFATGQPMSSVAKGMFLFRPNEFGFSLTTVYLIWIGIVALMYPMCKWYSRYKATHDYWWLPYL